ncbi:MAG TPA: Arc family DNA-binding protein [Burkholderiales bacterium]|nr:Arc family DNA-binding protein [Burkholderiales bacterium]
MSVTVTIKQVPDRIADKLRARAAASHRSLQGELMAILEESVLESAPPARQSEPPAYFAKSAAKRAAPSAPGKGRTRGTRLTLDELWQRARRLGPQSKRESAAIVRVLRDERYGR